MSDPTKSELHFSSDPDGDAIRVAKNLAARRDLILPIHNEALLESLRRCILNKTMPAGALGSIEALAVRLGLIQSTLQPHFDSHAIIVFAGDHGIADRGVSAYPKSVTWQMVMNFLAGGAAINVFARANAIDLRIVDAGVDHDFKNHPGLIHAKVAAGTADFSRGPAMSVPQCEQAVAAGARITREVLAETRAELIGFGEMGIGNSSSAAALSARLLNIPIDLCVGRGTGLDERSMLNKREVLREAMGLHASTHQPIELLACLGGFEIAMIVGGMLAAAHLRKAIVIDGYIVTSALLVAHQQQPAVLDYCIFSHRSAEPGHTLAMNALNAKPLLDFGLRLGEGSGAALAMPLLKSAARMLSEMASFDSAKVAKR